MVKRTSRRSHVASICVADLTQEEVVSTAAQPACEKARLVYALHVGGLLHLGDDDFVAAMENADLVYADGVAVVLLARAAGAGRLERAATTDIGIPVITHLAQELGRTVRIGLVGGPPGLAERAGTALEAAADAEVVLTADGYFDADEALLVSLRECKPDLVVVGLGMPYEAKWTFSHRKALPAAVILTCGGWFGFLAGEERRAPAALQRAGLEWTYRLRQDFSRLFPRYGRGAVAVARLLPGQLRSRRAAR